MWLIMYKPQNPEPRMGSWPLPARKFGLKKEQASMTGKPYIIECAARKHSYESVR